MGLVLQNGRLVYSTGVGVRVHGGSSRIAKARRGSACISGDGTAPRPCPANRVRAVAWPSPAPAHPAQRPAIGRRDRVRWHLVNPLAYDIATAIGAIASPSLPVRFLLNGEFQDVFVLAEHSDPRDYFVAHRGYPVSLRYASSIRCGARCAR